MVLFGRTPRKSPIRADRLGPNERKTFRTRSVRELIFMTIPHEWTGADSVTPIGKPTPQAGQARNNRKLCRAPRHQPGLRLISGEINGARALDTQFCIVVRSDLVHDHGFRFTSPPVS